MLKAVKVTLAKRCICPEPMAWAAKIDAAIAIANAALPDYARVQRWLRADEAFSFHNDLLTANGRLRRAALAERYLARIGGADPGPAPFLPIEQEIDA